MYTTVSNLKEYIGGNIDSDYDHFLEMAIKSAQLFIERYCGDEVFGDRIFELTEANNKFVEKYFDGNGKSEIPIGDLLDLNYLEYNGDILIENQDFFLKPYNAKAQGKPYTHIELVPEEQQTDYSKPIVFEPLRRVLKISGKFAYSETPPADIELATLKISGSLLSDNGDLAGSKQIKQETFNDYSVTYMDAKKKADELSIYSLLNFFSRKKRDNQGNSLEDNVGNAYSGVRQI